MAAEKTEKLGGKKIIARKVMSLGGRILGKSVLSVQRAQI